MIALARFVASFVWMFVAVATVASAAPPITWQATVDKAIKPLVDTKKVMGAVVGVLPRDGQREYFFYGKTKAEGPTPTSETLFEIGSVSKTFTALLLALAVERGEVKLDDPARALLPAGWPVPRRGEREITLLELATHTSGLPDNPPNLMRALILNPKVQLDPFSKFDRAQLAKCLAEIKLKDVAQPPVTYSNLGMGLLGEALANKADKSYDEMIREFVAEPLKMDNTFVVPSDAQNEKTATGHVADFEPVPCWTFATLSGCGAIRSNAVDMLNYLEAQSGRIETPLSKAMQVTQEPRFPAFVVMRIGLAWLVQDVHGTRFWWHNGGTNGFSTFAAFCRDPAVAVIVLSNSGPQAVESRIDLAGSKLMQALIDRGKETAR
jgi:D-alanyl-D-alanine-carboxypeptidase/D-alanyl-D-alanine-endopeptidase